MAIFEIKDKQVIRLLFDGWKQTFVWSCLENCMGTVYADDLYQPQSAKILLGGFCFFAGKVNSEIINHRPENYTSEFIIMVPDNKKWGAAIKDAFAKKAEKRMRYSTKKDKSLLDKTQLAQFVASLDPEYELAQVDEELFNKAKGQEWSSYLGGCYYSYQDFENNGLGFVIMKDGEIVSAASTYFYYLGGIEVEVDTKESERRKGFAKICASKLILECLSKGWYPNWDAHNKESLELAKKLGYEFDFEYPVYEISGY